MNKDEMEYQKWVYCPVCGNKTRVRLRKDTVLLHFPLFCPKCKKESLIDAEGFAVRLRRSTDEKSYCVFFTLKIF